MRFVSKKDIRLPKRGKNSKKGDNGKVLVVGGSENYAGAVALAGLAALRSGVDWVTIAAPEKVAWAINALSPDLVTKKLKGNYLSLKHANEIIKLSKKYDVVLIGNGLGIKKDTRQFVKKIINNSKIKFVVDADAIKSIRLQDVNSAILTPHKKELDILLKNSRLNKNNFKKFLKNNIVLLKGRIDQIITASKTYYNKTGNAGMSKAGTGDVLAGLCAGFLAQNKDLMQSAINATYYNGLMGDILLKKKKGFTYLASDMAEEVKKLTKKW